MPVGNQIDNIKKHVNNNIQFDVVKPQFDLTDIIVSDESMKSILSLVSYKKNISHVFDVMGFSLTHKRSNKFMVNFYGPPGTGKTITAHAIAKCFNKDILIVDYSQIESKYVGDTPKNLKKLFSFSAETDCLILFDEADAILSRRVTNMQSATDTSVNQTRSVLLNILNEYDGDVIFSTNFLSNYDPAFMRRISRHIEFKLPDETTRYKLFKKYIPKNFISVIDIEYLVSISDGISGSDIETATILSGFHAASQERKTITTEDISEQILSIKNSKLENSKHDIRTTPVSEEYVSRNLEWGVK
jgi:ATP-dependent 26S proteasome regulatory subunit